MCRNQLWACGDVLLFLNIIYLNMDDLPTEYDAIVIGTGMTGCIVSAALSRVGKAVLHIDENDFYGEEWASFNLETLETWLIKKPIKDKTRCDVQNYIVSPEKWISATKKQRCFDIKQKWHCPVDIVEEDVKEVTTNESSGEEPPKTKKWNQTKLISEHRRFNLDLSPRMLYSRGDLVELLISSNIARYAEFRSVSRVLTWRNERLEVVPCSRADVFATRHVSVVQKRMLVKILTQFAEYPKCPEEFEGFENKTFVEYLKHKKIDDQLIHYIVYAIAMCDFSTPCLEAVSSCQRFLQSLGRYGNTPFICPMYGSGDLPQCFCRLCAVFGGIYHLDRSLDGFIVNEENIMVGIVSAGQRLSAKYFVFTSNICPPEFLQPQPENIIHRAIFITNRSLVECDKEAVTLLQFPPREATEKAVTVMEMGSSCHVCPPSLFLVHFTTESKDPTATFLEHVQNTLFAESNEGSAEEEAMRKPEILWSLKWKMNQENIIVSDKCPSNLKIFGGPDSHIDFDASVNQAKQIFKELYPDEEFLPRAPDPEEILLDDPEPFKDDENVESSQNDNVLSPDDHDAVTEKCNTTDDTEE